MPLGKRFGKRSASSLHLEALESRNLLSVAPAKIQAEPLMPTSAKSSLGDHGLWIQTQPTAPPLTTPDIIGQLGGTAGPIWLGGLRWVEFAPSVDLAQAQAMLAADPQIASADLPSPSRFSLTATPNDPSFNLQTGLTNSSDFDIDAPEGWDIFTGSPSAIIAVADTGIAYAHADLYQRIAINQGEIPASKAVVDTNGNGLIDFGDLNDPANASYVQDFNGNGYIDAGDLLDNRSGWEDNIDNDANDYTDDLVGWDFINGDNDPLDDHGHGTHVSGTAGASTNNGVGVAGVDWSARILPLKVFAANGSTTDVALVGGINYASLFEAKSINASWGGPDDEVVIRTTLTALAAENQSVFVAAAGNSASNVDSAPFYPAAYRLPNLISVAAINPSDGSLAGFSSFGATTIDVGAPGVNTFNTTHNGGYGFMSGTSMATPHVSGVASLLGGFRPNLTASQVVSTIKEHVKPLASLSGKTTTGGIVSVSRILIDASTAPTATIDAPTLPVSSLTIRFTKPVTGVTPGDFRLTRDGGSNLLTGSETLTPAGDGQTYTLSGLSGLTSTPGSYAFTLVASGSGIADKFGNALAGDAQRTFAVEPPPVSAPILTDLKVRWGNASASLLDSSIANRVLPWDNINRIDAVFDGDANVDVNDLKLQGQSFAYGIASFSFNSATHTATWILSTPIGSAAWNALRPLGGDTLQFTIDGDDSASDGNDGVSNAGGYLQGGDRILSSIRVVPGDYNNNAAVTASDWVALRNLLGSNDIFADLDGDGIVSIADMNIVRAKLGKRM